MGSIFGPWASPMTIAQRLLLAESDGLNRDVELTKAHVADSQQLVASRDDLLQDSSSEFVFLHLPFPHPAGYSTVERTS